MGQVSNHNRFQPIKTSGNIVRDFRHLLTKAADQSSIDSFDQSDSCNQLSPSSIEGVAFSNQISNQSLEDRLISSNDISSLEGVQQCSSIMSQSQASKLVLHSRCERSTFHAPIRSTNHSLVCK